VAALSGALVLAIGRQLLMPMLTVDKTDSLVLPRRRLLMRMLAVDPVVAVEQACSIGCMTRICCAAPQLGLPSPEVRLRHGAARPPRGLGLREAGGAVASSAALGGGHAAIKVACVAVIERICVSVSALKFSLPPDLHV
jgi:hypothetical protein